MEGVAVVKLKAIEATPETFKEFGQVVEASRDGEEFGPQDAQLDLSQGTPRKNMLIVFQLVLLCALNARVAVVKLKAIEATPETFKEFGQVVEASWDGEEFGPQDAQLDLSQGTPRSPSYSNSIMRELLITNNADWSTAHPKGFILGS
nr:hypothetical protein CTI12_AA512470 [Tanacetum cinerariifolium]